MQINYRLVAFDLDDTTLDSNKVLRPEVAAALRAISRAGVVLLPATGRQRQGVPEEILALPALRYLATSNGAKLYDLSEDRVLREDGFSKEAALSILMQTRPYQTLAAVYINGVGYAQKQDITFLEEVLPAPLFNYLKSAREMKDDLVGFVRESDALVEKLSFHFASPAQRKGVAGLFSKRGDLVVTSSVFSNIELNTPGANKGAALAFLTHRLGIPRAQTLAIGDSSNDLSLLHAAGTAVAVANAADEIKAAADFIVPSCDEGGVALALEKAFEF